MLSEGLRCLDRVADMICFKTKENEEKNWNDLLSVVNEVGKLYNFETHELDTTHRIIVILNAEVNCDIHVDGNNFCFKDPLGQEFRSLYVDKISDLLKTVCSDYIVADDATSAGGFRLPLKVRFDFEERLRPPIKYGSELDFRYSTLNLNFGGDSFVLETSNYKFTGSVSETQVRILSRLRGTLVYGIVLHNLEFDQSMRRIFVLSVGNVQISLDIETAEKKLTPSRR